MFRSMTSPAGPPECDSTNRPLKRALVRKLTTKRPCSLIRMLVGYNAPVETKKTPKKHTHKHTRFQLQQMVPDSRSINCDVKSWTHPGAQPAGGCRCPPSRGSQCRRQRSAAARTAGQSVASHLFPPVSGTRRKHKGAPAGSRRTGPS